MGRSLAPALPLLALAALAGAEQTATRTDKITAALSKGSVVRVENVSGEIVASSGSAFSATVAIEARGSTQARARQLLEKTRILQTNDGADTTLTTHWPRDAVRRAVTARYALVIPKGVDVVLETVKGDVRVRGLDGNIQVQAVNGSVKVDGARRSVSANTVNGSVEVESAAVSDGDEMSLGTANGNVTLSLPKKTAFALNASTMNGSILSTFEMTRTATSKSSSVSTSDGHARTIVKMAVEESGEPLIEVEPFELELPDDVREPARDVVREMRRFTWVEPRRSYEGRVGKGGPSVKISTLNGRIAVLAAGTAVEQAREMVSARRSVVVTIPQIHVRTPRVRVNPPVIEILPPGEGAGGLLVAPGRAQGISGIERGDVQGDFLSTSAGGDYKVGNISGKVQIFTQWGEIKVASSGGSADLKTFGGNVAIGEVGGTLAIKTMAGSIEAGKIGGSATADTSGGDIRLGLTGGSVLARTLGGDVVLEGVGGNVEVETGGGDVWVRCVEPRPRRLVSIRNSGGDVELTLPADFRADLELVVLGAFDPDERRIRSDFPGLEVTRRGTLQRAVGAINGGGTKVTIQTASGSIRLKKE